MRVEIPERLRVLAGERARLAAVLGADHSWRALQQLAQREARGDWPDAVEREAERRRLEAALSANRIYLAWHKLDEAIRLLEAGTAEEHHPAEPERARSATGVDAQPSPEVAVDTALTRIRGLDAALAARLAEHGITTLEQIVAWSANDVRRLRTTLGLGRRISQEGWIEQAAMLLRQPDGGGAAPVRAPVAAPPPLPLADQEPPALPDGPTATAGSPPKVLPAADAKATAPKPDSLTARLFSRTPMVGPQRSLLAAIEAAEHARIRPVSPAPEEGARPHLAGPAPSLPAPAPAVAPRLRADGAVAAAEPPASSPRILEIAPRQSPSRTLKHPVAAPALPSPSATRVAPTLQPSLTRQLLAPIEDEAEVEIIARPMASPSKPAGPAATKPDHDAPILPFDLEAQGGEADDLRRLAAYRGMIEEARVEIVVRKPPEPPKTVAPDAAAAKARGRSDRR